MVFRGMHPGSLRMYSLAKPSQSSTYRWHGRVHIVSIPRFGGQDRQDSQAAISNFARHRLFALSVLPHFRLASWRFHVYKDREEQARRQTTDRKEVGEEMVIQYRKGDERESGTTSSASWLQENRESAINDTDSMQEGWSATLTSIL